ncbi:hypothetical protein CCR85_06215 [Rhodothalassium salexigens]|uniref:cytochrome b n=1 Tax=Rhodothalassium salexigens TaxID=1086 RepID=UPI001912876B|nr:cytochrome b [Rhodothalassium salexigens]MBK5911085.1 hypothetical protein [Rhodothalassium salexigens]
MKRNNVTTYDLVSRVNHWITAVAIIALLGVGMVLGNVDLADEVKFPLIGMHKAIGTLVLLFVLWRVFWRIRQGFPAPVPGTTPAQAKLGHAIHWMLLAGMVVIPASGILMSVSAGYPVDVFGLFTIPAMAEKAPALHEATETAHFAVSLLVIGALVLHVGAALKHHFVERDATLTRMVSGKAD